MSLIFYHSLDSYNLKQTFQELLTNQLRKSNHMLSQKINYTVYLEGEVRRLKISNEKTIGKQLACSMKISKFDIR